MSRVFGAPKKRAGRLIGLAVAGLTVAGLAVAPAAAQVDRAAARQAVEQFMTHLQDNPGDREQLLEQTFADVPLSEAAVRVAQRHLWEDHKQLILQERAHVLENKEIEVDGTSMRFDYNVHGNKPRRGRSLWISMHGGGHAPAQVNDQQWENQKNLYQPDEGIYLAPRAPTNEWNLWHLSHIDDLFDELIETLIVHMDVDPNRVYIMGYSAGGDGAYQLAPRMADRVAAVGMMAGHPNDAKPYGLRNIGFTLHMGEHDSAVNRNTVAAEWKERLAELRADDPQGYDHWVEIHEGHGHWMHLDDAAALPWMARFTRRSQPRRVVWHQSNVTHDRFYWLAVEPGTASGGDRVVAEFGRQRIELEECDYDTLKIRLKDSMMDLDEPVRVSYGGRVIYEDVPVRTIATMVRTLEERGDPEGIYPVELVLELDDLPEAEDDEQAESDD